jgi:hypothetical protein
MPLQLTERRSFERTMKLPTGTIASIVLAMASAACAPREEPTRVPPPSGAIDVREVDFQGGSGHQTDFILRLKYPTNSALDYYSKALPKPWQRCDWSGPEWESFLDGTVSPEQRVHQQLHMWINRSAHRTLMLAMRYRSPGECAPVPTNDQQHVIVAEYFGADVDETISKLKLQCPAREVRSNSLPHRDGREASRCGQQSTVPARGRKR